MLKATQYKSERQKKAKDCTIKVRSLASKSPVGPTKLCICNASKKFGSES